MILERPIECSDNVAPVCIPYPSSGYIQQYVGYRSRVIGWGVTNLVWCIFLSTGPVTTYKV